MKRTRMLLMTLICVAMIGGVLLIKYHPALFKEGPKDPSDIPSKDSQRSAELNNGVESTSPGTLPDTSFEDQSPKPRTEISLELRDLDKKEPEPAKEYEPDQGPIQPSEPEQEEEKIDPDEPQDPGEPEDPPEPTKELEVIETNTDQGYGPIYEGR